MGLLGIEELRGIQEKNFPFPQGVSGNCPGPIEYNSSHFNATVVLRAAGAENVVFRPRANEYHTLLWYDSVTIKVQIKLNAMLFS